MKIAVSVLSGWNITGYKRSAGKIKPTDLRGKEP